MKKLSTFLLTFSLLAFCCVSCGDDPAGSGSGNGNDDNDQNGGGSKPIEDVSTLTPGEHQTKLENIAKEFVGYFDAEDSRALIESLSKLDGYLNDDEEYGIGIPFYQSVYPTSGGEFDLTVHIPRLYYEENPVIQSPSFVSSVRIEKTQNEPEVRIIINVSASESHDAIHISDSYGDLICTIGLYPDLSARGMAWFKSSGTLACLKQAAGFSGEAVAQFAIAATQPDYTINLNDYAGSVYTYNHETEDWDQTEVSGNTIIARWDDSEATLTWSNTTKTWEGDVDYDKNAKVYVPEEITVTVKVAGREELTLKVQPNLSSNYELAPYATMRLNGGYTFTVDADASRTGVRAAVTVAKNNTIIAASKGTLSINDLTDTSNWFDKETYSWEGWNGETYTEEWTSCVVDDYICDNAKTGEITLDVLSATIHAQGDIKKVVLGADEIDDTSSKNGATLLSALINANMTSFLLYNDENKKVADIVVQPYLSYNEYWGGEMHEEWDQEPVLVFPDGSKFAFEDYFTSKKFSSLIDAIETLFDAYSSFVE